MPEADTVASTPRELFYCRRDAAVPRPRRPAEGKKSITLREQGFPRAPLANQEVTFIDSHVALLLSVIRLGTLIDAGVGGKPCDPPNCYARLRALRRVA